MAFIAILQTKGSIILGGGKLSSFYAIFYKVR